MRDKTGERQGTQQARQDDRADNQANRQESKTERTEMRQEGKTERTEMRQEGKTDRQENRQDFAGDAREDRQDNWDDWGDNIEDVDWNEVDWDDQDVFEDDDFDWGLGTWMALGLGTAVTVSAWNTMTQQKDCNLQKVEVNDHAYMKCGNTWYIEAYTGSDVHYVAVEAPAGY